MKTEKEIREKIELLLFLMKDYPQFELEFKAEIAMLSWVLN